MAEISMDERLAALENQSYVMYLQLNAATKILIDKEILDKELITKEMDELNNHLFAITQEIQEQGEATVETPAEPTIAEVAAAQAE
jgi:hypothetical protein